MVENLKDYKIDREEPVNSTLNSKEKALQEDLLGNLRELEKQGFDETKYIKQVQEAKDAKDLQILEEKFKAAALKHYQQELQKSGAFTPAHSNEASYVNWQLEGHMLNFETSSLGEMIKLIEEAPKLIQKKKKFRDRLLNQSLAIIELYSDRVSQKKDEDKLLDEILEENKLILKKPLAIQKEFLKVRFPDEKTLNMIEEKFESLRKPYLQMLQKNMQFFGGNKVSTPYGKMPEAAWEFMQWFEKRSDFKQLEVALKDLPKEIEKRKSLFEEAEGFIQHLPPKKQEMIRKRISSMRRHELKEYLEELEEMASYESQYLQEAHGLVRKKYRGISLFQSIEIRFKLKSIQKRDPEQQKIMLQNLQFEMEDRKEAIEKFLKLSPVLQKKYQQEFHKGSDSERDYLLQKIEEEIREKKSLEALVSVESLEEAKQEAKAQEELEHIKKALLQKDLLAEQFKKMEKENAFYRLKTQKEAEAILNKNTAKTTDIEYGENLQTEAYVNNYKQWMKIREGLKTKEDATSARELKQVAKMEKVRKGYEEGTLVDSYVHRKKEVISLDELEAGQSSVKEKIDKARYKSDIYIESTKNDGDAQSDLEKMQERELKHLAKEFLNKLIEQKGNQLSLSTKENLKNSAQLIHSIENYIHDNI